MLLAVNALVTLLTFAFTSLVLAVPGAFIGTFTLLRAVASVCSIRTQVATAIYRVTEIALLFTIAGFSAFRSVKTFWAGKLAFQSLNANEKLKESSN